MRVRLGSERLLDSGALDGRRVGVVCNPGVGRRRASARRRPARRRTRGARLAAHLRPAARVPVRRAGEHDRDAARRATTIRRVPVYSLYSETREPTAGDAARTSTCSSIDLQDVGTRIYTYIYTMANCLRRRAPARRQGRSSAIGRIPIGGVGVEGPMLVPGFESFVGLFPIPMRHGMTIGELARLFNEHFGIGADLEVVRDGRAGAASMYFDETGLPWVMPSPNMPTLDTRDRLSGHGAVRGHERVGRARHDAAVRAGRRAVDRRRAVRRRDEPRSACRASASGRPSSSRRSTSTRSDSCGGCQIHVPDRDAFRPVADRRRADRRRSARPTPSGSRWREPPYEYEHDEAADRHPGRIVGAARADRRRDVADGATWDARHAFAGEDGFCVLNWT